MCPPLKAESALKVLMGKKPTTAKAVFYYATIVESAGGWSPVGSKYVEPLGTLEGWEPQFCCKRLEVALSEHLLQFIAWEEFSLCVVPSSYATHTNLPLSFCPWCGASIEYQEHLRLRVVEEPDLTPRTTFHYEIVEEANKL